MSNRPQALPVVKAGASVTNLVGAVATHGKLHQFGMLLDEARGGHAFEEIVMPQQVQQKGNVGFHAANAGFGQRAREAMGGTLKRAVCACDLQGRVEGGVNRPPSSRCAG